MGRRREHDDDTAAALLDAAERTIAAKGVDALSLRDVARDAGTTTRAIYTLFGSKDGLLGALGVRAFDLLRRNGEALPATDQPARDLVERALMFRRFAVEHPALFSIAFHRADPAISPRFRAARLNALAALEKRFEPLAEADLLGGRSIAEATMQYALLCEGLAWGYDLRGNPPARDAERFWGNAVHALVTGFAAPAPDRPGRKRRRRDRSDAASAKD
jgi:AcrR family transcriptional regulator